MTKAERQRVLDILKEHKDACTYYAGKQAAPDAGNNRPEYVKAHEISQNQVYVIRQVMEALNIREVEEV